MCLEWFFAAWSALLFPCMPMWLGIQVRMMLLFLERVFILSSSLVMTGVYESLLCRAWRSDLESEEMINLEDLWFAIMFMARSITMTSALWIEDSFGRHFNSSWFWKTAAQSTIIPCLNLSVYMWWWWSGKLFWSSLGRWTGVIWFRKVWLSLALLLVGLLSMVLFWGG